MKWIICFLSITATYATELVDFPYTYLKGIQLGYQLAHISLAISSENGRDGAVNCADALREREKCRLELFEGRKTSKDLSVEKGRVIVENPQWEKPKFSSKKVKVIDEKNSKSFRQGFEVSWK